MIKFDGLCGPRNDFLQVGLHTVTAIVDPSCTATGSFVVLQPIEQNRRMSSEDEQLIVIIDASARGWEDADASDSLATHFKFEGFKGSALAFLSCGTLPVVLAYNDRFGGYLFPPPAASASSEENRTGDASGGGTAQLRRRVDLGLSLLRHQSQIDASLGGSMGSSGGALHMLGLGPRLCSMAACLCAAACFANRRRAGSASRRSRVLAFQAGPDIAADYIAIVNATYSCLRLEVPIDFVDLSPPICGSGSSSAVPSQALALQQASLVSGGRHCAPAPLHRAALFEFLVVACLPDSNLRSTTLLLPPAEGADLRAHCFCHAQRQSVAWVCPVCLAIWCTFSERCVTCGTTVTAPAPVPTVI